MLSSLLPDIPFLPSALIVWFCGEYCRLYPRRLRVVPWAAVRCQICPMPHPSRLISSILNADRRSLAAKLVAAALLYILAELGSYPIRYVHSTIPTFVFPPHTTFFLSAGTVDVDALNHSFPSLPSLGLSLRSFTAPRIIAHNT